LSKINYEIKQHIAALSSGSKGWKKELNLISWNGFAPKYDIRDWDSEHAKMGKGVTLSKDELKELYVALRNLFENEPDSTGQGDHKNLANEIMTLYQNAPMFMEETKNILIFMEEQGYSAEVQKILLLGKPTDDADPALLNEIESLASIYSVYYNELLGLLSDLDGKELQVCLSLIKDPSSDPIVEDKEWTEVEVFYCKGKDASASGYLTGSGFTVLKGAICNLIESATAGVIADLRNELKEEGILIQQDHVLVLQEDYTFSSPSAAAGAVLARRANGWTEWKNENGVALDALRR
jgi:hypothetical protein